MNRTVAIGIAAVVVVIGLLITMTSLMGPPPPVDPDDEPARGRAPDRRESSTERTEKTDEPEPVPDDAEPTGVRGRVELGDGRPAAGARVELFDREGTLVARSTTRSDGSYLLPWPGNRNGPFILRISHESGSEVKRFLDRLPDDDETAALAPVTLTAPGEIRGRVTYRGKRARGASISFAGPDGRSAAATVERDGTYVVEVDVAGRWRAVAAWRSGEVAYGEVELTREKTSGVLDLDLQRGQRFTFLVRGPNGLAEKDVELELRIAEVPIGHARTDANGRARIRAALTSGESSIVARGAQGFADEPVRFAELIEVTLRPWRRLNVAVIDGAGSPIRGATLQASAVGADGGVDALQPEPGMFLLEGLTDAPVWLIAQADGFETRRVRLVPRESDEVEEIALFPLESRSPSSDPSILSGRVVWPDGRAVVGAEVGGGGRSTRTDSDGRFLLTRLAVDDGEPTTLASLVVRAPGRSAHAADGPFVGGQFDITIVVARLPALSGHVRTDEGEPVLEFELVLEGIQESHRRTFRSDDGSFFWPDLPPDSYRITAYEGRASSTPIARALDIGADVFDLDLRILPSGSISGVVRSMDLSVLGGARVTVRNRFLETPRIERGGTDGGGRFTIKGLEPGTWELVAEAPGRVGSEPMLVDVAGARDRVVEVRLASREDEPMVVIVVRTKEPGEPEFKVFRTDAEGILVEPFVEPMGRRKDRFRLRNVDPGEYRVEVKMGDRSGKTKFSVGPNGRVLRSVIVR